MREGSGKNDEAFESISKQSAIMGNTCCRPTNRARPNTDVVLEDEIAIDRVYASSPPSDDFQHTNATFYVRHDENTLTVVKRNAYGAIMDPVKTLFTIHPKPCRAVPTTVLEVIDEIGGSVTFVLPDGVDRKVATAYVQYVTNLKRVPFPSTARELVRIRAKWTVVDDFFGGNVREYPTSEWTEELYNASARLGNAALRDHARRHDTFKKRLPDDQYKFLVEIPLSPQFTFNLAKHRVLDLDFEHCALMRFADPPKPNWASLTTQCMGMSELDFPWYATTYKSRGHGVLVAGGKLVSSVYGKTIANQDVDIFIVADNKRDAYDAFEKTIRALERRYTRVVVHHDPHVTNIYEVDAHGRKLTKYQVIRKAFPSPSHLVHGFDVDVCGILFDGKKVFCTQNAARALASGYNLYDENKLSTSGEHRYAKYMHNYGLATLVAGVPNAVLEGVTVNDEFIGWTENRNHKIFAAMHSQHSSYTHDFVGVLHHFWRVRNKAPKVQSDYDEQTMTHLKLRDCITVDEMKLALDGVNDVFTGAFNPVRANTLQRVAELMS
jgi:hypothetical protein